MHEPHVIPQWQLNKSELELQVYFDKMLADDHHRLLIVGIDGKDVGYTEIYGLLKGLKMAIINKYKNKKS